METYQPEGPKRDDVHSSPCPARWVSTGPVSWCNMEEVAPGVREAPVLVVVSLASMVFPGLG